MKFDVEICDGVSCPECPFNRIGGCLLAKRLDEMEITPEPCEDAVPRVSVEYICRKNTVSTNPYEHKYHDKFIQFMDDPEISDFGRWQHSNGFNTALVAVKCDLEKVPSAQPERKKGKWETVEGWDGDVLYRCSECGTEFVLIEGTPEENDYRFCPHCGADTRRAKT